MEYCKSYLAKGNPVPTDFIDLIYALDEEEFAAYVNELRKEKKEAGQREYYYNKYMIDDRCFDPGGLIDKCRNLNDEEFEEYLKEGKVETLKEKHFDTVVNYSWEKFENYLQNVTAEWQRRHRNVSET